MVAKTRICALALALFIVAEHPATGASQSPNIVLILTDDLGWADLPSYGNEFHETPNIDAIAREGMRFTDFYAAASICSPTRASIFSGQYPARIGMTDFVPGHWRPFEKLNVPRIEHALPLEIVTPAEALKNVGYRTGYFGKWHLGGPEFHPSKQGFDEAIVTSGRHFSPRFRTFPPSTIPDGTLIADWLTDQTTKFIHGRKDQPFFVTIAHYAVHIPLESHESTIEKYRNTQRPKYGVNNPTYAAMVEDIDRSVGRIMDALNEAGLGEDTLVIFTSDNGGLHKTFTGRGDASTSNTPLRDEKGTLFEGGIRVPLIVRWPQKIAANTICREPTISIDFLPTILELTEQLNSWEGQTLDGQSLLPLFANPNKILNRDSLFFHYPHYHHSEPAGSIRMGDWKLIEFFADHRSELYNLRWDIGESKDWSNDRPAKVAELKHRLREWRTSVSARMPTANPRYDPARAQEWWSRRTNKPIR